MKLLEALSQKFDFRIHLIRCSGYGLPLNKTANWTGLAGMLERKEVDIAVPSLVFAKTRIHLVDSGLAIFKLRLFFVFRHPKYATTQRNLFLMPLSKNVWWTILGMSLLMVATFVVMYFAEKRSVQTSGSLMISSILEVIGILAQQGLSSLDLNSLKSRTIIISFLLLSFICLQFYSGSIVGSLLTPPRKTITTVKKLTETNLKIVMEAHPGSLTIFQVAPDSDIVDMYEKKVRGQEVYLNPSDGIKLIKKGQHAILIYVDDNSETIKSGLTHAELDELQQIPFFHQDHRALLYMLLQKGSPFNEVIRVGNLFLIEVGIQDYHIKKWTLKLKRNSGNSFSFADVDFQRTSSIFYMLCFGYLLSLLLLLGEFLVTHLEKNRRKDSKVI